MGNLCTTHATVTASTVRVAMALNGIFSMIPLAGRIKPKVHLEIYH